MNQPEVTRIAARIPLLAGLVAINAFPFFTNGNTSYETIFFALSAVHAELCLFMAWGIFVEKHLRYRRMVWCLMGTVAAVTANIRLLSGESTTISPWQALLLGIGATAPAILPMAAAFTAQRYFAGTKIVPDSVRDHNLASFPLKQLFVLTAGCGFLSLLLRQAMKSPDGWLTGPVHADAWTLIVGQSFVMGLLTAPCALTILKPNRYSVVWLVYFVAIAAVQPFIYQVILNLFERRVGLRLGSWIWPESYPAVVMDNFTWYGPQLLPTVVLFVVLRLTGVRIQDTK